MYPRIDHIQITVKDFVRAVAFYDQLMPILGFDLSKKGGGRVDAHDFDVVEYMHESIIVGINSPRKAFKDEDVHRRKPGALHHLAFRAASTEEVDEVYPKIAAIPGVLIVNPPKYYPQHGEAYYALFIKDPDGIKLEVMFEER
jgi:catechol 2,3-dioxygenase-like lactoylglutathione lyase family enzyme